VLASFTVLGQIGIVAGIIFLFIRKQDRKSNCFLKLVEEYALFIIFSVSLTGTLLSLYYSDYIGLEPCVLCWWQRIFLYPQVILAGIATWKNDRNIFLYSLWLSIIGAVISGYQSLLQYGVSSPLPCAAGGTAVSCAKVYFMEFGYITIPLMAFTAFLITAGAAYIGYRGNKIK
jgi:disulfide bond formation protein DsbB